MEQKTTDKNLLLQAILDCGVSGAALLTTDAVIVNEEFRKICQDNGCGAYNRCYMCPPDIGPIHQLMEKVKSYSDAVLYQSISQIEDPFDFEGMMAAGHSHTMLSQAVQQQIRKHLPADFLHLSSGGCHLCQRCGKPDGLPCRHPDSALPGMEGYGIDVYQTASATHLQYINGQNTVTYFGIVLF